MPTARIAFKRSDDLDQYPQIAREVFGDTMEVVVNTLYRSALDRSPKDRSFFVSAMQPEVVAESSLRMIGRVYDTAQHAAIIEGVDEQGNEVQYGRRPGTKFPNVEELRGWVRRHSLALEDRDGNDMRKEVRAAARRRAKREGTGRKEAHAAEVEARINSIAYLIGRAIVRRGLPREGWSLFYFRPMGRALEQNRPFIERSFIAAESRIARRLERLGG